MPALTESIMGEPIDRRSMWPDQEDRCRRGLGVNLASLSSTQSGEPDAGSTLVDSHRESTMGESIDRRSMWPDQEDWCRGDFGVLRLPVTTWLRLEQHPVRGN